MNGSVDFSPLVSAGITGLISGFVFSIPVGPINLAIVNEGARRGFFTAALIAFGAICMDTVYCAAAFAGFSTLLTSRLMRAIFELFSFLAMIYLGIKYLRATHLPATTKSLEVVEHRFHPHTAFMVGFVRVLGNPAVFLFWITLSATFISHEWIANTWVSKSVCVLSLSAGALTWFLCLSFLVSLGHGRFSARTLVRLSHLSGAALLMVAVLIAVRLVRLLAHR